MGIGGDDRNHALSGDLSLTKLRVRLSLPFWGHAYAHKVVSVTLPALLASGNLPALAADFDVEVALVTQAELFEYCLQSSAVQRLQDYAKVHLIALDDLLTGVAGDYGPVLTFALIRGYEDLGERMLDYYLMFLNADFVLADGSYATAARLMREGCPLIRSPSFRAIREDVLPLLQQRVNPVSTVLAIPPREMVQLAMRYRHITVRARTVNQPLCHQWRMDQFYWAVDEQTLLCSQWPVYCVALKPQRVVTTPKLMFDYGFIPEICPGVDDYIIGDSDDFFILEPQQRLSGYDLVRMGGISVDDVAAELSRWTTQEHRECGQHFHVFHGGDLPSHLPEVLSKARDFIANLTARLGPAIPHDDHPLFRAWWAEICSRIGRGSGTEPPKAPSVATRVGRWIYEGLFGVMGRLKATHPLWLENCDFTEAFRGEHQGGGPILWVAGLNNDLATLAALADRRLSPSDIEVNMSEGGFAACFVDLCLIEASLLPQLYQRLGGMIRKGGRVHVRIVNDRFTAALADDAAFCEAIIPNNAGPFDVSIVGGVLPRLLRSIYRKVTHSMFSRPRLRLALILATTLALAPFAWGVNRLAWSRRGDQAAKDWLCLTLRLTPRP